MHDDYDYEDKVKLENIFCHKYLSSLIPDSDPRQIQKKANK